MIIVGLVVLVPLIACMHSVEVLGLTRPVLVMPPVHLYSSQRCLLAVNRDSHLCKDEELYKLLPACMQVS